MSSNTNSSLEDELLELVDQLNDRLQQLDEFATIQDATQIWILIGGFLVFFMHAGFTMLEAGSVQHRNAVNIMFKNVGTLAISGIAYYLWGYAFAYGTDNADSPTARFIGSGNFALSQITNDERHLWFFQWAFAATATTILSGAVAGRVNLLGYFIAAFWITSFVYPVVSHWVWATGGWASVLTQPQSARLFQGCGFIDFAGSGVVHMVGGIAALWGAIIIGPRIGRYEEDGTPIKIPAHNLGMVTLGTLILWFGWYGFNVGSTLSFNGAVASKVAVTTTLSASASALTAVITSKSIQGHFDLTFALNSVLGGLVAITAPCPVVEDWAAIIIGFIACFVFKIASYVNERVGIDDPVDAIAVHGACGIWGCLAVGIFATSENISITFGSECPGWGDGLQFASQLVGVLAIFGWVSLMTIPCFFILKKAGILRVSADFEKRGLDASEHGGQAAFIGEQPSKSKDKFPEPDPKQDTGEVSRA